MTISVIATCWTTQYDLSNWVIKDSIKIDTHLFTDSLEPNTNSAEFVLSRTCPYLDELLAYDDAIGVSIAADDTTYFTGYFTDSFRFSITSRGAQDVKIECEDPGIRKLKTAWVSADGIGTTFAGDKICDPADTAHSVLHKIATLAGVTLASGLPTISQQVYMVVLDKDGRTYWDVLSKLLLEHLYVFDFDASGQLYLFALTSMTGSPVQTLTTQEGIIGDNSTPGIVVNKRLYDTREIDVRFDEISTVASGIVHRDTTGQTATYDCLIPIAPGKYYPDTCNADTYAYIDYKTEDGRDVVMVDSATLDVSKDSGITAEFANLGKSARIRFYNGGGTTQYIYRLKVNATNIRVKSANSKVIAGEASRHKREIDASTITTKAEAQAFGNLLYYYYKNSKQVYQFRGYRGLLYPSDTLYPSETLYPNGDLIEPGEIIRLYDPIFTGLDATVMVTRKRYTLGRSGAEYEAVGIGPINLNDTVAHWPTVTPQTLIPGPVGPQGPAGPTGPTGPAGQPAIIANLSNESHTVPTDANGNNGNYTGCATTMSIFIGSTDDSANWTVTASPSTGVTGSLAGRTYTVTNLTADTGYVDLTASRSGYSSITCRFTVSKAKGGIAYMLVVSAATIQKSQDGVYTPSTITVSAKSVASAGTVADYAGRFVIAETTDGSSYTDKYTSSANETSKTYTPSAGIKALRCRLYLAGGTSTLLDEEIIPIVVDGPTGPQGPQGPDAPRYLGRYYAAHPSSYLNGDWWLVYDTDDSPIQRGVWYSNNGTPTRITTSSSADLQGKLVAALADIAWAESKGYGKASNYGGFDAFFTALGAVEAYIQRLFAGSISIITTAGNNVFKRMPATLKGYGGITTSYKAATFYDDSVSGSPAQRLVYRIPCSGTIRVNIKCKTNDPAGTIYVRPYKNGSAAGVEHSVTGTTETLFSDDISVSEGDLIEVYAKIDSTTALWSGVTDFYLSINETPGLLKFLSMV